MSSLKLFVLCSLFGLISRSVVADEYEEWLDRFEKWVQADDGSYQPSNILDTRSLSELQTLTTHSNDSIATQAAWKTVALAITDKQSNLTASAKREKIVWFIGFLEGRNRVVVPQWWKEIVSEAKGDNLNRIDPSRPKEKLYHPATLEHVTCPISADVFRNGNDTYYIDAGNKIHIPKELYWNVSLGDVAGKFTQNQFFIATHRSPTGRHGIACLNRADNKLLWNVQACGCLIGGNDGYGYAGVFSSWADLVPTNDNRLFVFGASDFGFYVHAFNESDGKTLLIFSNNF